MKGLTVGLLTTSFALAVGAGVAQTQKPAVVPLGDVARLFKAQLANSAKKPRVFTNADLIALRDSSDPAPPALSQSSPAASTAATAPDQANQQTRPKPADRAATRAVRVDLNEARPALGDYIDQMSKVQVVGKRQDAENGPTAAKLGQPPIQPGKRVLAAQVVQGAAAPDEKPAQAAFRAAQATVPATGKQPAQSAESGSRKPARQDLVTAPFGEWAKAKFRGALGMVPETGEPGPIAAQATVSAPVEREDLGYVERADGKVEAIVAEGDHIGLVEESKEYAQTFRFPAPTPAELEMALAPPSGPPEPSEPGAEPAAPNTPAANELPAGGDVNAQLLPLQPPTGNNGEPQSEASATLQSEPLADYTGDQSRAQPPETLQVSPAPAAPPSTPDDLNQHPIVKQLGYVEKAGGEKEAILEFRNQVYLVHEGELFAGNFRLLHIAPNSVEVVEELTEASSAAAARRRLTTHPPADSK